MRIGRVTLDLTRRSWVGFPPRSKDFFFTSCGSLFPFTRANAQWVIHGLSSTLIYTSELILCSTICVPSATRQNIHMYPCLLFAAIHHLKSSPTFSVRPCSSVGRVTVDLIRRSWVRFPTRSKDFFFASCGSLFPFTRASAQWVIHGLSSTLIYTSELILCSTICVPSATRHNIPIIYSSLIPRQTICLDIRENVTKGISKAERSRDFLPEMSTEVSRYSRHICKIESSFLSSTKTPQNIYICIWIPASQPSRHMGSTPRNITQ